MEQQQEEIVKGYTLQEFRDNPELLKQYKKGGLIPCICEGCLIHHNKTKNAVLLALRKKKRIYFYCNKQCLSGQAKTELEERSKLAYTLQELREDPTILSRYKRDEPILCICGVCQTLHTKVKNAARIAVFNKEQEHFYCLSACNSKHRKDTTWAKIIIDGVMAEGRPCKVCGQITLRAKMAQNIGWICSSCTNKKPRNRFRACKQSAKNRNLDFDLSFKQFMVYWKKPCYYCSCAIETIGLDRVDNSVGYVYTNVVSCCPYCNSMKLDGTQQDFIYRCVRISKNHGVAHDPS